MKERPIKKDLTAYAGIGEEKLDITERPGFYVVIGTLGITAFAAAQLYMFGNHEPGSSPASVDAPSSISSTATAIPSESQPSVPPALQGSGVASQPR